MAKLRQPTTESNAAEVNEATNPSAVAKTI
jgi:hypothetical protein